MKHSPWSIRGLRWRLRTLLRRWRDWRTIEALVRNDPAATALRRQWGLGKRHVARLKALAQVRGESLEETCVHTMRNLLRSAPFQINERNVLRHLEFKSVELEHGLVKLCLTNGRVFYSYPSRLKYVSIFNVLRDIVPPGFTAETYQAGVDVVARYQRGGESERWFPGPGGVVIEGGAYIGYKAVRFAETVAPAGKVIAIEIGRQNYELLRRNIEANDMGGIVTPVHCGIWSEPGQMEAEFEHANWYHLATPDEHDFMSRRETVPTDTLDNIMDAHDLETVDFINLQLNGAEYEGIEGLDRRLKDVKIIRTAAYYTRQGKPQVDAVRRLLEKKGCTILSQSRIGLIVAATPGYAKALDRAAPAV